jgi:hypothetical protein
MINKYYLIKKLLTSNLADKLEQERNEMEALFDLPKLSVMELYDKRVEAIKYISSSIWVEDLTNISRKDVTELFNQRDYILDRLSNKSYAEILIKNGHNFKEVLEGLLDVTLDHIKNYEKAEKFLTGNRLVTVIIDGNNHNITKDGKRVVIQTEIEDNTVTLEKCKEVTEKIRSLGHEPKELKFVLSIYTETPGNNGDFPEECLLNRNVYYYPQSNCMRIWENGVPIYENCDGIICTDQDALADCLL